MYTVAGSTIVLQYSAVIRHNKENASEKKQRYKDKENS